MQSIDIQNPSSVRLKYLTFLSALYVTIVLLTMFVENKVIIIASFHVSTGTLIIPLTYTLSDIITEVYGYREMRKLIWCSILILYMVATLFFLLMHLPAPKSEINVTQAYNIVLQPFFRDTLAYSIAAVMSVFLNSYILSKWKILVRGKFFWLRSLGSSAVGEFIFMIVFGFLAFFQVFPFNELKEILFFSFCYKIICNLISIFPASVTVLFLKKSEKMDVYDVGINFNPFEAQ